MINLRSLAVLPAILLLGALPALAQSSTTGATLETSVITNDGTTGTTVNKLAKINSSGNAVITATADTDGAIGVVLSNAGTTAKAQIARGGITLCAFDGTATVRDFVQISSSVAGDCHDTGSATRPTSGQVIGYVEAGGVGAGTYTVQLQIGAPAGSGTGTVTSVTCGSGLSGSTFTTSGTCALYFDPGSITNCTLAASVATNNLTIALKNQAGADPSASSPCTVSFRNTTATTGDYTAVNVTAATSITFNSGSGFGAPGSSTPFRIWVTAWNNAGTVVLGASNQTTTNAVYPINEGAVQSSTACNACTSATSSATFYTTAAQSSKAIRIIGYMEWNAGLATTGVWVSGPTLIQLMGPGIYKPGERIRKIYQTTSTGTTSTVSTFAATGLAQNFTMAGPANSIAMRVDGSTANNSASTSGVQLRIYRGSAACTTAASPVSYINIAANLIGQSGLSYLEVPYASETTSALYTVCVASPNSPNSITFPFASGSAQFELEEIMG